MTLSGPWTQLGMPSLPSNHSLQSLLNKRLKRQLPVIHSNIEERIYWDEDYFSLPSCRLYQAATDTERLEILADCNQQLMKEATTIEKAGMAYSAKMSLLAESSQERMIYSLFAADEATHFHGLSLFLEKTVCDEEQPFLSFLSQLIDHGEKGELIFTIQVILEGWGLTHYRRLAESCQNLELRKVLQLILRDEVSHHNSGLVLVADSSWTSSTTQKILETLTVFLNMVRCGPLGVVNSFEKVLGDLSRKQKHELLNQLKSEQQSAIRLELLKNLMGEKSELIHKLKSRDCFRPLRPEESV